MKGREALTKLQKVGRVRERGGATVMLPCVGHQILYLNLTKYIITLGLASTSLLVNPVNVLMIRQRSTRKGD